METSYTVLILLKIISRDAGLYEMVSVQADAKPLIKSMITFITDVFMLQDKRHIALGMRKYYINETKGSSHW